MEFDTKDMKKIPYGYKGWRWVPKDHWDYYGELLENARQECAMLWSYASKPSGPVTREPMYYDLSCEEHFHTKDAIAKRLLEDYKGFREVTFRNRRGALCRVSGIHEWDGHPGGIKKYGMVYYNEIEPYSSFECQRNAYEVAGEILEARSDYEGFFAEGERREKVEEASVSGPGETGEKKAKGSVYRGWQPLGF